jgi:hypothetical protein
MARQFQILAIQNIFDELLKTAPTAWIPRVRRAPGIERAVSNGTTQATSPGREGWSGLVVEIGYPRLGELGLLTENLGNAGHDGLDVLVSQLTLEAVVGFDGVLVPHHDRDVGIR